MTKEVDKLCKSLWLSNSESAYSPNPHPFNRRRHIRHPEPDDLFHALEETLPRVMER